MKTQQLGIIVVLCILLLSATIFLLEHNHRYHGKIMQVPFSQPPHAVPSDSSTGAGQEVKAKGTDPIASNPIKNENTKGNLLKQQSLPNPQQSSKFAYVTLISGITKNFAYRGFLYNTLIMRKSLVQLGSTADFIALIGYAEEDTEPFEEDMNLLRTHGVAVYVLPRLLDKSLKLTFAEMALLKVTPWSFLNYERIQFFDGDVMPTKNMDCFFELDTNTFTIGAVSPLNSGWYLAIPDKASFEYLKGSAIWRLQCDWDEQNGWSVPLTDLDLTVRGGKPIKLWNFNGCNMDQGLLTHHFILREGKSMLIDTDLKTARVFSKGLLSSPSESRTMSDALKVCDGNNPLSYFAHFTGRSKPWLQDKKGPKGGSDKPKPVNWSVKMWLEVLDSLKLPVNSSNVFDQGFNSPLGYFDIHLPKKNVKCSRIEA